MDTSNDPHPIQRSWEKHQRTASKIASVAGPCICQRCPDRPAFRSQRDLTRHLLQQHGRQTSPADMDTVKECGLEQRRHTVPFRTDVGTDSVEIPWSDVLVASLDLSREVQAVDVDTLPSLTRKRPAPLEANTPSDNGAKSPEPLGPRRARARGKQLLPDADLSRALKLQQSQSFNSPTEKASRPLYGPAKFGAEPRALDKPSSPPSATKRKPNPGPRSPRRLQILSKTNSLPPPQPYATSTPDGFISISSPESPVPELVRQLETRAIPQERLVTEVKSIYHGLLMVEAKCIEVDGKQAKAAAESETGSPPLLTNDQWQALISLHRTLLHEHHDFFLASLHPSANRSLRRLASKYSMPARMWRYGIHSFLELLRHRLPGSIDHMLSFIYQAYSMMALLYETVPAFEETWIECLGDLGRYRMAIEDDNIHDREVWTGVARFWYSKAADKTPNVGRLYHHLAILARPNYLQQLSYYSRSLTCVQPFFSARESILNLFENFLGNKEPNKHRASQVDTALIRAHAILFTGINLDAFDAAVGDFTGHLAQHIGRVTARWKELGVYVAISGFASLFEYGAADALFTKSFQVLYPIPNKETGQQSEATKNQSTTAAGEPDNPDKQGVRGGTVNGLDPPALPPVIQEASEMDLSSEAQSVSRLNIARASNLTFSAMSLVMERVGDKNILPYVHVSLVFLWNVCQTTVAMKLIENNIPRARIVSLLNSLVNHEKPDPLMEREQFPKPSTGSGRPLPEDFSIRGQVWSQGYFPDRWFEDARVDDEERSLELPSMAEPRVQRILWLGVKLTTKISRFLQFDGKSKVFSSN
ncbi:MAG: hypothetical protein M1829_002049 [Trizodia sp. TS-e1964]|nr:MAG: hypothetical protein M1829_002049 [Trizodia sp. TS-e1964]